MLLAQCTVLIARTAVLIAQKLAQLCYLPKTKHSCAISTVQSANRLKLSTAVLIAQTVWAKH